jgi:hypothetical protein
LGLDVDYDYSPTALRKIVRSGATASSFREASSDLSFIGELQVSTERVRRATERIGAERVAQRDVEAAAYEALPIPARRETPADQPAPSVVCVQMDGGRLQVLDRKHPQRNEKNTFWREMKVGCLWTMSSEVSSADPCPQLPPSLVDRERVRKMVREIKGFSGPESAAGQEGEGEEEPRIDERPARPKPLARSVVASRCGVEEFGELLASEAHQRGFGAADRKAFVADGSEANWGVWRRHFSDYVPILDFIHALTYVYAAAMAGQPAAVGWRAYRLWAQWLWEGRVESVIVALELRQQALGEPAGDSSSTEPGAIVKTSLGYLQNQRSRMNYPEYRKAGLTITSSYVESTVKQIARRVKGTEKFWSKGAEALLTLAADHLGDTAKLDKFWHARHHNLTGTRVRQTAA